MIPTAQGQKDPTAGLTLKQKLRDAHWGRLLGRFSLIIEDDRGGRRPEGGGALRRCGLPQDEVFRVEGEVFYEPPNYSFSFTFWKMKKTQM